MSLTALVYSLWYYVISDCSYLHLFYYLSLLILL